MSFTLQQFFDGIDELLGIQNLPIFIVAIIPVLALSIIYYIVLVRADQEEASTAQSNQLNKYNSKLVFAMIVILLVCVVYSILDIVSVYINDSFVTSLPNVMARILSVLILLIMLSKNLGDEKLWLFALVLLNVVSVLQNDLSAGIYLSETAVDTVNIFATSHWLISYHNPVYDALPSDSVVTVFLMHMVGISEPFDIFLKVPIDISTSLVLTFSLYAFARHMNVSPRIGCFFALFGLSLPYLTIDIPPINISVALMALILFALVRKNLLSSSLILLPLAYASGILAHPETIQLLLPLGIFYVMTRSSLVSSKKFGEHSNKSLSSKSLIGALPFLIITFIVIFLIYLIYTAALESFYGYARGYVTSLLEKISRTLQPVNRFSEIPTSIKLVYTASLAPSVALLLNDLKHFTSRLRNRRASHTIGLNAGFLMSLRMSMAIALVIAGITLISTHPFTKHFGIFAYLSAAFSSLPLFALIDGSRTMRYLKAFLVVTLVIITVMNFLTPHKMFDQYSWGTMGARTDYHIARQLLDLTNSNLGETFNITVIVKHPDQFGKMGSSIPGAISDIYLWISDVNAASLGRYFKMPINLNILSDGHGEDFSSQLASKIYDTSHYDVFYEN